MPGTQIFTHFNIGKETTRGTPVAPTRQFYAEGTGVIAEDIGLQMHDGENRGRRSIISRVPTQQIEDVTFKAASMFGVGYDDMVFPLTQLKGGLTGVGGGADKTWTGAPSMTAANNPEAFSIDIGDDIQNWRLQYGMLSRWKLSSALGDVTRLDFDGFAQRAIKTAAATPGANAPIEIPGDIWTVKFATTFAGLGAAAVQTNLLISHDIEVMTGLIWRHYQDGNLYGAQHVETRIGGTWSAVVESTAFAVSEFYDKWKAQTVDYMRLKATGPALGASNYSLQFDCPIVFSNVSPIDSEDNDVNLYKIEANLYDDGTNPPISPTLVCSLAAIP